VGLESGRLLNESSSGRIFISYRRQETAWPAGRLYDVLVEHFSAEQIFKDVDNIEPGVDFTERVTATVGSSDVLLVLIGPEWLRMTDKQGQHRLDDPGDYVRLEIETALARNIRVIPILVDNARMPGEDELPPTLAPLVRRNAVEINPVTFDFDTKRLISTVRRTLAELNAAEQDLPRGEEPRSAAVPRSEEQQSAAVPRSEEQQSAAVPDRGRTPPVVVDENVQFTVYRPSAVQPEVWYPLLSFAHLAGLLAYMQVEEMAAQALGDEAAYSVRVDARRGVPRGGQLTFVPFVEGVDFNPRSQTFEWQEDVHLQSFRLKAQSATVGRVLRGQLTVYLGPFIIAGIDLTFRVDLAAPPPLAPTVRHTLSTTSSTSPVWPERGLTPVTVGPYQKIFPSYSHKDLAIVRQAEANWKALGNIYMRDRLALRSGEEWEVRLLELIDEADIFQLFWSSNSKRSKYVRREWKHAYALNRPEFIRPNYWEMPMPSPPDELAKLHFHCFNEDARSDGARSTRLLWLIVAILAVLVALVVVAFLLRG
jgi:TIR domain